MGNHNFLVQKTKTTMSKQCDNMIYLPMSHMTMYPDNEKL